jgi:hypothetical protein
VVAGRVRRHQDQKFARQDAEADDGSAAQDEPAPAQPEAAPADPTADRLDQLKQLGELKSSGVLTDAEFEAQKAKILAG